MVIPPKKPDDDELSYEDFDDTAWLDDELEPIDLDALDAEIPGEEEDSAPDQAAAGLLDAIDTLDEDVAPAVEVEATPPEPVPDEDALPVEETPEPPEPEPSEESPAPPEEAAASDEEPAVEPAEELAPEPDDEPAPDVAEAEEPAVEPEIAEAEEPAVESVVEPVSEAAEAEEPAAEPEAPPEPDVAEVEAPAAEPVIEPAPDIAAAEESAVEPEAPSKSETEPEAAAEQTGEPETPPEPVIPPEVYCVLLPLPPELASQVVELRKIGEIKTMPPPGILLTAQFRTTDLPAVEAALAKWARAHLPFQFETVGVSAKVTGAQQYIAAWTLEPEEEIVEAQHALRRALAEMILPLPGATMTFSAHVPIGEQIAAARYPQVIGHMQRDFEPFVWRANDIQLVRQGDPPDTWETVQSFD